MILMLEIEVADLITSLIACIQGFIQALFLTSVFHKGLSFMACYPCSWGFKPPSFQIAFPCFTQ